MECNQAIICGEAIRIGVLRYTPAGVPVINFVVRHTSRQMEANITRQINCELPTVAIGATAKTISEMRNGNNIKVTGFLNRKSHTNQQLVLHVDSITQI
ncbi:primosomal replication protein N [Nitrosomonas aestuarii]|uniref:primosomal replication protein N n=1 Tax=Nitrosomonas aestuarii TaxID=52441 RepID=UPI000B8703A8|nr:primosomal replication protein N [Nitrosomonas aestuarii]